MKTILTAALLALPMAALADHLDLIEFKLEDGGTFATELQTRRDFNTQWGDMTGYRAAIATPIESDN